MTEQGAGVRKRILSACRKQELEEHQRRGWDGGIRTHDIRVKVWCVTITLHPNIGAKSTGIGITPNPRFRGVGKGVRTLDTRNHNPVLSRLSYTHHRSEMVRQEGFEPPAYCLEGSCSIQLSYWRELNGAGDGNRTRIPSLEGWCPSHCATPACALRKNRQLCYNSISVPFCQRFFRIFLHFFTLSE